MSRKPSVLTILSAATTTATGTAYDPWGNVFTFHGFGTTSSGTGASAIIIEVSNDNLSFITMGTITLTLGTTVTADGFSAVVPWKWVRARVSSISGTGAAVSVIMGNISS